MASALFAPFRLDKLELPNRIVVAPMAQYSADERGNVGPWHLMHVGNFAVSGAGLVMMEATAVEPRGRISLACLGLWNDVQAERLQHIVQFCHAHGGARIGIQLAHSGRKGSVEAPWRKQAVIPTTAGGWTPRSCSVLPFPGRPTPEMLSASDLDELKMEYSAAATRADAAGFDVLELHCAHGYLLHSFLSPLTNIRQDEFGGDLHRRMRFPLEVFHAIRTAWPTSKPVGVRVSATDWIHGGWSLEDTIEFANRLSVLGCAYISVSSGGIDPRQRIPVAPGYQVFLSDGVRRSCGVPTIAAGLLSDPSQADAVLREGRADLIAIGRGMTYDPRWAWHAAAELGESVYFPPQYERSHPSMRFRDFYKVFDGQPRS